MASILGDYSYDRKNPKNQTPKHTEVLNLFWEEFFSTITYFQEKNF